MSTIVLVTGRYHLGNDPGIFQDAQYVGFELNLPFTKTWIQEDAKKITFNVYTHDVETWGMWRGHKVSINGVEIGRLIDGDDLQGSSEVFKLEVPRADLLAALGSEDRFEFSIELERQPAMPGLADDFVLWRIETDGTFAAHLGWK